MLTGGDRAGVAHALVQGLACYVQSRTIWRKVLVICVGLSSEHPWGDDGVCDGVVDCRTQSEQLFPLGA